jgi:hypothetical protein
MFSDTAAAGTAILSPFKGFDVSVTWIVPPLEPIVWDVTGTFEPEATETPLVGLTVPEGPAEGFTGVCVEVGGEVGLEVKLNAPENIRAVGTRVMTISTIAKSEKIFFLDFPEGGGGGGGKVMLNFIV